MDLKQVLANISGYHPDSYSTQVLIGTGIKAVDNLSEIIESLKCCGNCKLNDMRSYPGEPLEQYCGNSYNCIHETEKDTDKSYWSPKS